MHRPRDQAPTSVARVTSEKRVPSIPFTNPEEKPTPMTNKHKGMTKIKYGMLRRKRKLRIRSDRIGEKYVCLLIGH
jgi:hypothetical protein